MKILTFAASNSRKSINKQLVQHAAAKMIQAEIDYIEINDFDLPIYSIDLEQEQGIPMAAHGFLKRIKQADGILVSFAEHNGNYTVAFKNLFDWMSRIDRNVYQGKPIAMLSTSPGPGGGRNVLKLAQEAAPHFGGQLVGSLSIPSFNENFNSQTNALGNDELAARLDELLNALQASLQPERESQNQ